MHILIHDYGGYSFPVDLSQELARRGHTVTHAYCSSLQTTPPGIGRANRTAPPSYQLLPVSLGEPLNKYDFVKRWRQERKYGRRIAREASRLKPDLILSANTPLDAQNQLLQTSRRSGVPFIFWLQDLLGIASHRILKKKLHLLGDGIGRYYKSLEESLLRKSDAVVAITEDFLPVLEKAGVHRSKTHVIPNWGPLRSLPVRPKTNAWSNLNDFADTFCYLYAGTLGMKHNPNLLLQLARAIENEPGTAVVVISQGLGATWLKEKKDKYNLNQLYVLPYQDLDELPDVLATGDVLIALLEPEAGGYSVPSKVMTYLCAGRPLLLAVPKMNKAAQIVSRGCGLVVDPHDADGFLEAARKLEQNTRLRRKLGSCSRTYAESHFDINTICNQFESICKQFG